MKEKKSVVVKPAILKNVKTSATSSNVATIEKHVDQKENQQLKIADLAKSANMTKTVAKKEKAASVKEEVAVKEEKKKVETTESKKVEAPKKVEKKVAEKKPVEKKPVEKKAVEKKPVEKKKAEAVTAKEEKNQEIILQYGSVEVTTSDIYQRIIAAYEAVGNKESMIKEMKVYVKPEENKAYYVINQEHTASVSLS